MRSELFEEAWKQNRHVWESTKCLAQAMYLAGEQHQQSKVDELQKRVDNLEKLKNVYRALADAELEKCTDGLFNHIERLEKLEQALKGGCDE